MNNKGKYFFFNIVRYINMRVITLGKPEEDVSYQLEVGPAEIFDRNDTWIAEPTHLFAKVA